jgi:hypothetical protein
VSQRFFWEADIMPRLNYKLHDITSLRKVARELQRLHARLEAVAAEMEADEVATIKVPNNTILIRGLSYISKFVEAARDAQVAMKVVRGDYDAEGPRKRGRH